MQLFAICLSIIGIVVLASLIIGLVRARSISERSSSVAAFVMQAIIVVLFLILVCLLKQKGAVLITLACLCAVLPILAYAITFNLGQKKERKKILQDRQNQALYMQQMISIKQANAQRGAISASGAAKEVSLAYSDAQITAIMKRLLEAQGIDFSTLTPQQKEALQQYYKQKIIQAAKLKQAQQAELAHKARMQQQQQTQELQLQKQQQLQQHQAAQIQEVRQAAQIQQVRQAQQLQQIKTQVQSSQEQDLQAQGSQEQGLQAQSSSEHKSDEHPAPMAAQNGEHPAKPADNNNGEHPAKPAETPTNKKD